MLNCCPKFPQSSMTTEFVLCGLYLQNRAQAVRYFQSEDAYRKMVDELCVGESARSGLGDPLNPRRQEESFSAIVTIDPTLIDVLCRASEISTAADRPNITVADFIKSVVSQPELLEELIRKRNLRPRPSEC